MATMAASLIPPMASSLIRPVASLLINAFSGKGFTIAVKGQEGRIIPLLALPLMIKVLWKGVRRAGRGHNKMDLKFLVLLHPLKELRNYKRNLFSCPPQK